MSEAWETGPEHPLASPAEAHVWRVDLEGEGRPGGEGLPAAERERAERMRRPGSGERWAAARWALRRVLGRYLGEEPAAIELAMGPHGKPELAAASERLAFNLSHSGGLGLVAVTAGREIGVDVEEARPGRDFAALARRELSAPEAAAVAGAPEAERAGVFYAAWTRHEARLKCLGSGLGGPRAERPLLVCDLDPGPGYAAAVACTGSEAPGLRLWAFPWR